MVFCSDDLLLSGVLRLPERDGIFPAVLLVHGSMEQDRDGNLLKKRDGSSPFRKNFFLEIARRLCALGFAVFSWDRRGCGKSEGRLPGDVFASARDARAALDCLLGQEQIDPEKVAVLGQSAGVYTICLLAKDDHRPKAYVLQGGLFQDYREMMAFNYTRVVRYASKSAENLAWVEENDLYSLIIGLNLNEIFRRSLEGKKDHDLVYRGLAWKLHHDPSCYLPENAPSRQFKFIDKPALIIHGDCDLNVPVNDAVSIYRELNKKGNQGTELAIISGADHSFQEVPEDMDIRYRERISLESFRRAYSGDYFRELERFLISNIIRNR